MNRFLSWLFVFYVSAIPAASATEKYLSMDRDISAVRLEMGTTPASDVGLYLAWAKDCDYPWHRNKVVRLLTRAQAVLKGKDFSEFKRGFDIYSDLDDGVQTPFCDESEVNKELAQIKNSLDLRSPETLERARRLAAEKRKIEAEKSQLAEEASLLAKREAKRRAEERKRKIAEARRAIEQEKALYEALASTAKVHLSHAQEFLSANPGAPGLLDIITYMAGTKAALKERKGSTVKIALASLRATLSKEKGFSAFIANKTKEQQRRLAEEKRRAEAKHKRELAEAKRREEEKRRRRATLVLNAKDDLKSYADFLKRQISQLVMSKPEMTQVMVYTIRSLEGGLSSNDLTVLEGLKSRAVLALKNHNLLDQYAEVEKMMAGARSAGRNKEEAKKRRKKEATIAAKRAKEREASQKRDRALATVMRKKEDAYQVEKKKKLSRNVSFDDIRFGDYYALVIGNNNYRHLGKLKTAVNDAKKVAEVLRGAYGFRVNLLIDATRAEMLIALSQLRATLKFDDNLLIYYAGHGLLDEIGQQGYWMPVDAEEGIPTNWISIGDITVMLRAIRAKHALVVADSCYSGTLVRTGTVQPRTAKEKHAWVKRILGKRSRVALVSGGLEPVADGGGDGNHSVFAGAFIKALNRNTGVMEGRELFDQIKRPVVLNSDQTPSYSDIRRTGHDGGDFILVRRGKP